MAQAPARDKPVRTGVQQSGGQEQDLSESKPRSSLRPQDSAQPHPLPVGPSCRAQVGRERAGSTALEPGAHTWPQAGITWRSQSPWPLASAPGEI